ncbi:MAG: hypothetical protein PWQ20_706 [Thermotogaceae bacterium]|nr:hypothetical protein [Thermotogaceae bacterium]MDN5337636.1 hypothetical protein [Thermotogaceae bacterium]
MKEMIVQASKLSEKVPKLFGIPSGVPGLDELFYTFELDENDEIKKVSLNGIPSATVVHLTGISDTGKSLIGEQFALNQASRGYNVLYITVEIPAPFLIQSLKQRSKALKIPWENVEEHIYIIDAASHSEIREDVLNLTNLISKAIEENRITATVIDSITGLYENKEVAARSVVRKLYEIMKKHYQTAIFISQKRSSHEENSAEAAGGYAVPHITDCTIVLSKMVVNTKSMAQLYGRKIGDVIRTIRIDGCRVCGHDPRTHLLEINDSGVVRVGPPLEEVTNLS